LIYFIYLDYLIYLTIYKLHISMYVCLVLFIFCHNPIKDNYLSKYKYINNFFINKKKRYRTSEKRR